jgi:hypothetical protein
MRALFVLAVLAGCPSPEDTDDTDVIGDTDDTDDTDVEVECPDRLEVEVVVYNDRLWYVEDATVTWSAAGGSGACTRVDFDRWTCDTEGDGPATISVTHDLYVGAEETVAVGEGGCRSGEEVVDVTLLADSTPFEASRMYYIQRYEDDYECEHSWEIHGTGCYYTAAFCKDGYSSVMLTDIANFGVYDIEGADITNVGVGILDIPVETDWEITSDTTIEDWTGVEWKLDTESKFSLYDCLEE